MKTLWKTLLAAGVVALATQANAIPIFTDNFDTENGGVGKLKYTGFTNWTVSGTAGSVDLQGNGFYDYYPGNGLYVDLDGSTRKAGKMTYTGSIILVPDSYDLSFTLGGNALGGPKYSLSDTVLVTYGVGSQSFIVAWDAGLSTKTIHFSVGSSTPLSLTFFNSDGGDHVGPILDNVQLVQVPEGGLTAMLLGVCMIALVLVRRKVK
jgi:hypothetical protein